MRRSLFLCPHGAAKSVLAAAFFQRAADRLGLDWHASCAGTEPDPEVMPAVRGLLEGEGLPVPAGPNLLSAGDLAEADLILSLGCDLHGLLPPGKRVIRWDDLPPVSQDPVRAAALIRSRVEGLAAELAERG